ncbi:MAG: endonuclease/exonuclease/phosphatase family protein [Deltaproteobacteria bacterium]|nr:endonuclease/exonuclease/phosphatase family protein [Deltaproteobacteria bacterium]
MNTISPPRSSPKGRPRAIVPGLIAIATLLAVLGVFVLNRFVHQRFITANGPRRGLRVLTWNVGKLYLPWESRASDRDLRHVAKVICAVNPHVVALQEMRDAEQLGRLLAILGRGWRGAIPHDPWDRRPALLIRLHGRFFTVPTTSGRVAQGATVDSPSGRHVTVVSLHLDAFDAQRRYDQAQDILASLEHRDKSPKILLGDFNIDPRTATKHSVDERLYGMLTRDLADAGAHGDATTIFARRIDYVFYSKRPLAQSSVRVLREQRIHAMDHDPLVADISFKKGS